MNLVSFLYLHWLCVFEYQRYCLYSIIYCSVVQDKSRIFGPSHKPKKHKDHLEFKHANQMKEDKNSQNSFQKPVPFIVFLILLSIQLLALYIYCQGFLTSRSVITTESKTPNESPPLRDKVRTSDAFSMNTQLIFSKLKKWMPIDAHTEDELMGFNKVCSDLGTYPLPLDDQYKNQQVNLDPGSHWLPARYNKTILFVIDALRYDFITPVKNSSSCIENGIHKTPYQLYHQQLPIMTLLAQTFSECTLITSFIADPPTTSLQRLSGITSGTLSTYLEAAYNFGAFESHQDNIIYQFAHAFGDHQAYFMGDSTWTFLYPKVFPENDHKRVYPYYSFHLFDLFTVDNMIKANFFPLLLKSSNHQYQLAKEKNIAINSALMATLVDEPKSVITEEIRPAGLFNHFLGVDHCGHKYGPRSSSMASKLNEMNDVIIKTILNMDDSTVFFAFGDHGMTEEGDHGGMSIKEILAGLFAYSHTPLNLLGLYEKLLHMFSSISWIQKLQPRLKDCIHWELEKHYIELLEFYKKVSILKKEALSDYDINAMKAFVPSPYHDKITAQVDFTPTFALLLGLPIPFSNIGSIIPELFWAINPIKELQINSSLSNIIIENRLSIEEKTLIIKKFLLLVKIQNTAWLCKAARLNSQQIIRYILTLIENNESEFRYEDMKLHITNFLDNENAFQTSSNDLSALRSYDLNRLLEGNKITMGYLKKIVSELETVAFNYLKLNNQIAKHGRRAWARFDESKMVLGIWILLLVFVFLLSYGYYKPSFKAHNILFLAIACVGFVYYCDEGSFFTHPEMCALFFILIAISSTLATSMAYMTHAIFYYINLDTFVASLFIGLHSFSLAATSFIVFEDYVVRHFISCIVFYGLISNPKSSLWKAGMLLLLTKLSGNMGVCREEQFPYCSFYSHSDISLHDLLFETSFILPAFILPTSIYLVCFICDRIILHLKTKTFIRKSISNGYKLTTVGIFIKWLLTWYLESSHHHEGYLLRIPFFDDDVNLGNCIVQLDLLIGKIICLYILSSLVFFYRQKNYAELFLLTSSILFLFQRPIHGIFIFLLFHLQAILFDSFVPSIGLKLIHLHLLGLELYFTSGHQFILTSIQWEAAFSVWQNPPHWLCGLCIFINTMAGPLLCALFLPLIIGKVPHASWRHYSCIVILPCLAMEIFCLALLRHMMIWQMFTPRFLFQITMTVSISFVLLLFSYFDV